MNKNKIIALSVFCFLICSAGAQTFNYSFNQSTVTYQELSGATTLVNGGTWSRNGYLVPLDFNFNIGGKGFTHLTVTSNGLILFGDDNTRAICAFKGVRSVLDSTGGYSVISYQSSGSTGSKVLKIQYRNCGFGFSRPDLFNFQVWFYEQGGKIEFRTGYTSHLSVQDSLIMPVAGILDPSMSGSSKGYLIAGDPVQPATGIYSEGDIRYLIRVPVANTVYTLTSQ